jgi:energy-coupling factor transporter ATP-binding protein EcfA2
MALADRVQVSRRFQRSIRVDTDWRDPRALQGFVCPKSSADVLETMARHIQETGHGAFTWTGPYGSGKSSLVIALSALLSPERNIRREAEEIVGTATAREIWRAMSLNVEKKRNVKRKDTKSAGKGWTIVPVVGRRDALPAVLGEALVVNNLARRRSTRWTSEQVIDVLSRQSKQGGLLLVIDEMGKILESAGQDGTDIYPFQQLAEAANRSNGSLIVVGVLHQALDEYAQRLSRELRDEWAKVQGRFIDLSVSVSGDEQLELLARAIDGPKEELKSARTVAEIIRKNRATRSDSGAALKNCWPLHPVVSCLLGPISRRRFGQNQRSLFGFLSSAEPFGFQDFIQNAGNSDLYYPDRLWDYLRANLENAILASPDGHRWSTAVDAVERCERLQASPTHLRLLKTIALIDLFRERSGLFASPKLLEVAVSHHEKKLVADVLKDLLQWSLVLFRTHIGAYSIYAGSDFDIEAALVDAMQEQREVDFRTLRSLAGLQPILAKRHYHQTGSLRWFDLDIVPVESVSGAARCAPSIGAMGRFLLAIATRNERQEDARRLCIVAAQSAAETVVIGLSAHGWRVTELAREFLALSWIHDNRPELIGDPVARREVRARLVDLHARLESELQKMATNAAWIVRREEPTRHTLASLNGVASDIADRHFSESPHLANELLNRDRPSSNAVAAQKALLKRMAMNEGEPRLGITGFPSEGGLFDSILLASDLYREEQSWRFAAPSTNDPCRLGPAWTAAIELVRAHQTYVALSRLYELWQAPPFGIKAGLLPVLGLAFILSHRDRLALYRERVFRADFSDLDVDYLAMDPSSVQIRWIEPSSEGRELLDRLAELLAEVQSPSRPGPAPHVLYQRAEEPTSLPKSGAWTLSREPVSIARALVAIYDGLSPWSRRTVQLSHLATGVRDLLKNASDPNKLLLDDIGTFRASGSGHADGLADFRRGLDELRQAYSAMLKGLSDLLIAELEIRDSSDASIEHLRARAKNVLDIDPLSTVNAFAGRLTEFANTERDIEGIVSLAVSKPPRDWVDADISRASAHIVELCRSFRRLELYAGVKGRKAKRHAVAVYWGFDGTPSSATAEFEIGDADRKQVDKLVASFQHVLSKIHNASDTVVLAALARMCSQYLPEFTDDPTDKSTAALEATHGN